MNMDLFVQIQKIVFDYCDNLPDKQFIELVDGFVFDRISPEKSIVIKGFVDFCDCHDDYLKHIDDIINKDKRYFLKCSGSKLQYLELVRQSLLVSSYNRLKRKYV